MTVIKNTSISIIRHTKQLRNYPKLQIGGPAICFTERLISWVENYLNFCKANKCLPDFFSFHFYMHTGFLHEVQNTVLSGFQRITIIR
jgi:hypothetical protein